jgi:NSS family neurotransmitter:Na+ symporter
VGLGNIWRFPYVVGENGGSAFVIIYLLCAFAIGLPLLVSELAIGRLGRLDPAGSYRAVATNAGRSMAWGLVGTLAIACVFAVLSFYTVISGWTFDYFVRAVNGSFDGIDAESSTAMFAGLMNNPWRLLFWHTVVNLLVIVIIRRGVQEGVERAAKILMPILFGALIVMVIYSAFAGDLASATKFLLEPDFSKVTAKTVMIAVGQAFFSVGVAMATMITFGAYLPEDFSIPKSSVIIILADTGVAMLAGFVIFPLVFEFGYRIWTNARRPHLRGGSFPATDRCCLVFLPWRRGGRRILGRYALEHTPAERHPLFCWHDLADRHYDDHVTRRVVRFLSAQFHTCAGTGNDF